jgi:hypothetical protein
MSILSRYYDRLYDEMNYDVNRPHPRTRWQRFVLWVYFGEKPYRGPGQVLWGLTRVIVVSAFVIVPIALWWEGLLP